MIKYSKIFTLVSLVATLLLLCGAGKTKTLLSETEWQTFLNAVRVVETGNCPNEGENAIGDGGKAIGPFQIWKAYHTDSKVAGDYSECNKGLYSRRVVKAYLTRWAPDNADMEVLARIHNGGPRGHKKSSTTKYWQKVKKELK